MADTSRDQPQQGDAPPPGPETYGDQVRDPVAHDPEAERRSGVRAGCLGSIGCVGVTFAGAVFIAAAVVAFVLVRGCGNGDQPGPTVPEPLDPTEVRDTAPAPPG